MPDFEKLARHTGDLDERYVYDALRQMMDEGGHQVQEAMDACQQGMAIVGDRFESGEYYLDDLIFAGNLMSEAMAIIKDALVATGSGGKSGSLVLCTVADDIHDIGKNIVKVMLEANGFEVVDLGVNVSAERIVSTAREKGIKIIALSGVLTFALDSMKDTVDAFVAAGMRDDVKIIIGGAPVVPASCKETGADEWAHEPQKTIDVCKKWSEEIRRENTGAEPL